MLSYVERKRLAIRLTREELNSLPLDQLQGAAQLLGTSGKCYDGKQELISRVIKQQETKRRMI